MAGRPVEAGREAPGEATRVREEGAGDAGQARRGSGSLGCGALLGYWGRTPGPWQSGSVDSQPRADPAGQKQGGGLAEAESEEGGDGHEGHEGCLSKAQEAQG